MIKWVLLSGLLVSCGIFATDKKCITECRTKGGGYHFCHAQCTLPPEENSQCKCLNGPIERVNDHQVDAACLESCKEDGYKHKYCIDTCSLNTQ